MPAIPPSMLIPLRWTRALVMLLLAGASATATALGINMFDTYNKAEGASEIDIGDGNGDIDVLFVGLVLCITLSVVMAIIAFQILVALLQDTLHFCPAYITHRLKIAGKALSTSTLPYQLVVLGACTALLLTSLVIWTVFAVKREITNVIVFTGFSWSAVVLGSVGTLFTLLALKRASSISSPKPNIPEIVVWKPSMDSVAIPEMKFDPGVADMELIARYLVAGYTV